MSDARDAEPAPQPAAPAQWNVLAATAVGASHQATGRPGQDAFGFAPSDHTVDDPLAVAVADGHGHRIHFRSQEGARLAVKIGCDTFLRTAGMLAACVDRETVQAQAAGVLLPELVAQWRTACTADLAAHPVSLEELEAVGFPEEERADVLDESDPLLAYGSTLMVAGLAGRWLVLAHIGDGDMFTIEMDGTATSPVPGDPLLDGQRTTSLCQPDALDSFRIAVLDLGQRTPAVIGLATDGYGNAQIRDDWQPAVAADLARYLQHQGRAWVGAQLTDWVTRCASVDGSADDTTMALLISPSAEEIIAPPALPPSAGSNGGSGREGLDTNGQGEPASLRLGPPGGTGALLEATRERTLPMAPSELPAFSVTDWPSSANQYFPDPPSGGGPPPGLGGGPGGGGQGGGGPGGSTAPWGYPPSAGPASPASPPPTKIGRLDPRLRGRMLWIAATAFVVLVAVVVAVIVMTGGGGGSKQPSTSTTLSIPTVLPIVTVPSTGAKAPHKTHGGSSGSGNSGTASTSTTSSTSSAAGSAGSGSAGNNDGP